MMGTTYEFRKGFAIRDVDAQTVGDELYRIRAANDGKLQAEHVVDWAADPSCAIHACFTWDDERAAHLHRLGEARTLLKSIVIVSPTTKKPKPAYFNVSVATAVEENGGTQTERYYQYTPEMEYGSQEYYSALHSALKDLTSSLTTVQQLWDLAPRNKRGVLARVKDMIKTARGLMAELVPDSRLD